MGSCLPINGVALYSKARSCLQEQVQTNKDLDLPTQRELLAQFRCDEISTAALQVFNEQAKPQKRPIESGRVVEGLGKMMRAWRSGTLERYDRDASRYHQGVYKRKRADLVGVLDSTLSPLFFGQLKNLHKASLVQFKKEMQDGVRGEGYNFAEVVAAARSRLEKRFLDGAQEALVEGTDWTYEEELGLLREEARIVADQLRKDETKKMVNVIEVCRLIHFMFSNQYLSVVTIAQRQEADFGACRSLPQSAYTRFVGQGAEGLP